MIRYARINFQFTGDLPAEAETGQSILKEDPFNKLISTISALNEQAEKFSIAIHVSRVPLTRGDNELTQKINTLIGSLTKREIEVYDLAIKGFSNKLIAEKLFITIETVKSHRTSIVRKAGVGRIEDIKNLLLEVNRQVD